jgi:SpoVK/Ycf46/Vps4 family AAA+-type ATPase
MDRTGKNRSEFRSLAIEKIQLDASWDRLGLAKTDLLCLRAAAQTAANGKMGGALLLFIGPDRAARMLAAAALAMEAGLSLYRVDLGSITGKYIGETEKNIDSIFRQTATSSSVLYFDDADSLFGDRTETSETSRYANLETGYLLQRINAHPGIVVLASNRRTRTLESLASHAHCTIEFPE